MIYEIRMPSLGADMEKGKFIEWKVKVGEHVEKDQEIAIIETQKAATEIDSYRSGTMLELLAEKDKIYPVGAILAKMELDKEYQFIEAEKLPLSKTETKAEIKSSVKLPEVISEPISEPTSEPIVDLREAIAKAMSRSKKEIPHYYLRSKINVDGLINRLDKLNESRSSEERVLFPAVLIHAATSAIKKHPNFNGQYVDGKFTPSENINVGMAIALKTGGVVAPAILGAEKKSLYEINQSLKDLIQRARENRIKASEFSDGTITMTNLGDLGTDEVYGVIFPPQVALLGFGQIRKEPIMDDSTIKGGLVLNITLSADHRVSDGLSGARFLQTLSQTLTGPNLFS